MVKCHRKFEFRIYVLKYEVYLMKYFRAYILKLSTSLIKQ